MTCVKDTVSEWSSTSRVRVSVAPDEKGTVQVAFPWVSILVPI